MGFSQERKPGVVSDTQEILPFSLQANYIHQAHRQRYIRCLAFRIVPT